MLAVLAHIEAAPLDSQNKIPISILLLIFLYKTKGHFTQYRQCHSYAWYMIGNAERFFHMCLRHVMT